MRAFVISELGQPGQVAELPDPQPGDAEILVRVREASVNPMDAFVVSGAVAQYADVRVPLVPGLDAVGTVVAIGSAAANGFKPGDEVVVTTATKPFYGAGTFAELVSVPKTAVAHKPAQISDEAAAGVPQTGLTALAAVDALEPNAGDDVAVVGATGGVGSWFVQLAKNRGARVIALARPQTADYVRSLGADAVIDYTAPDWLDQVRATAPDGIDALADFSGNTQIIEELSSTLRPGGRLASSAARLDADAYAARGLKAAQANRADPSRMMEVLELLESGKLQAPATRVMTLEQAGQAIDEVSQKHTTGKVVLKISD
jgi:NADPH:quinone reductase-like Zn-dependent oxidoreductase